jgi:hypothetical protein
MRWSFLNKLAIFLVKKFQFFRQFLMYTFRIHFKLPTKMDIDAGYILGSSEPRVSFLTTYRGLRPRKVAGSNLTYVYIHMPLLKSKFALILWIFVLIYCIHMYLYMIIFNCLSPTPIHVGEGDKIFFENSWKVVFQVKLSSKLSALCMYSNFMLPT